MEPVPAVVPDVPQAEAAVLAQQTIDPNDQSILKSRLDNLDRWQTAKLFRRIWLYAFMMATLNTIDGWQVGSVGRMELSRSDQRRWGYHRKSRFHEAGEFGYVQEGSHRHFSVWKSPGRWDLQGQRSME